MAGLCKECSEVSCGQDHRELAGLCKNGGAAMVLCLGCGLIHVDVNGKKLNTVKTLWQLQEEEDGHGAY